MKLITEELEDIHVLISEEKETGKKSYCIEGIFLQGEKQNKNGRVYPIATLKREVDRYNEEYVKNNRALGELGHPEKPQINLDRASHLITSLKQSGNDFVGKAKILDTPMGNIAKGLLDSGVKLGVSTRGVGSLKPFNGYQLVQDDYKLATAADIVHDPSAPNAFVNGIMENIDWWYDSFSNTWHQRVIEDTRNQIKSFSNREIEEKALTLLENFISKVSKL